MEHGFNGLDGFTQIFWFDLHKSVKSVQSVFRFLGGNYAEDDDGVGLAGG